MTFFNFFKKKSDPQQALNSPKTACTETKAYKVSGTERNYQSLDNHDVALKFWLPEAIDTVLNEMCHYGNTNRSDLIRQTLFTYLYGRYDLFSLIERGNSSLALNSSPILFSKAPSNENRTPELGKNIVDVKVWLSTQIKNDLQILADNANISLSHFIRELLISNLLGHTYLPERESLQELVIELEDDRV